jgi:sortase (surface protein transpeptidase)
VPGRAVSQVPAGKRPVRLQVPRIGVDSSLVDLGIAADGTLQVPTDYARAGWLTSSPAPGQVGPAVIAGHVDSATGPAVFYKLRDLAVGDAVVVVLADGTRVRFSIDDVEQYAKAKFPTDSVYGPAPGPVLRLITCGGTFDATAGHYRDNVVAYAS